MKLSIKVIGIVLVSSILPILVLANFTLMGVSESGRLAKEGVVNVSNVYIEKAGQEAVRMKAEELAAKIDLYLRSKIRENPNLTTLDLMTDPDFLAISAKQWGMGEYTWVMAGGMIGGERRVITLIYPTLPKDAWGKDIKDELKWNTEMPEFYNLTVKAFERLTPSCGYYTWIEPKTRETTTKYLCYYMAAPDVTIYDPRLDARLILAAGTAAYIDGYFKYLTKNPKNPSETIASEVSKNVEGAVNQVYTYLAVAFVIAIIFTGLVGYVTVKNIANPIVELSKKADKISEGEIDTEVPFRNRDDEVGMIANSIEKLRRSLKIAMQSLEEVLK